jgi:hypothetical protein
MGFLLALLAAVAVQKDTRDIAAAASERSSSWLLRHD